MRVRHVSEKYFRTADLITYNKNGRPHRETGAAFIDRRYGSQFWIGGIRIVSSAVNHWEIENAD